MMNMQLTIDKHTIALISIVGSSLDVLGGLYLAYDLLGGEHGPLRTLTRGVTYAVLFGAGYGLALGPVFGVITGLAHGVTLGWEYSRASRGQLRQGFWHEAAMSALRGCGFGLGLSYLFGTAFGATFATLSTVGQTVAYQFGMRPTVNYNPANRPRVTRLQLIGVVNRTIGYSVTGYLCSLVARQPDHAIAVGLKTGLTIGLVTALTMPFVPWVEWTADRVPEKLMGVVGVGLMLTGCSLQSLQYWVAFLDVTVK